MSTLQEYNKEIQPLLRNLVVQKDTLKSLMEGDERVTEIQSEIKTLKEELQVHLETTEDYNEVLAAIKDIEQQVKDIISVAAEFNKEYTKADLKAYFVARSKDKVEEVINKGEVFELLNKAI